MSRQLLNGLQYLHGSAIVHADVKMENVMIANVLVGTYRELLNCVILDMHIDMMQGRLKFQASR